MKNSVFTIICFPAKQNDHRSITAEWGRPLFVSSLYATSCLILLAMAGYFESHRSETFEAVHRGTGPVSFSVKFSIKGEKVNLYLRLGLASEFNAPVVILTHLFQYLIAYHVRRSNHSSNASRNFDNRLREFEKTNRCVHPSSKHTGNSNQIV